MKTFTKGVGVLLQFTLDTVFLAPREMKRSIRFYSSLFGFPVIPGLYESPFYPIAMTNGIKLMLAHRMNALMMYEAPMCLLTVPDIDAAFQGMLNEGMEIVSRNVETRAGFRFFLFRGIGGATIMAGSQSPPYLNTRGLSASGPLELRIDALHCHCRKQEKTPDAHAEWLGALWHPATDEEGGAAYTASFGNDTRIVAHYSGNGRQLNPLLTFQTANLDDVRSLLKEHGVNPLKDDECLLFADPDGYIINVKPMSGLHP